MKHIQSFKCFYTYFILQVLSLKSENPTCTCRNLMLQETCESSRNCIWKNGLCERREIQCPNLLKFECLLYPQCYYTQGECMLFSDCNVTLESCSRFSDQCASLQSKCISKQQNCNTYINEEECKLRNIVNRSCYWNGINCEIVTMCSQLPKTLQSDSDCRKELSNCTVRFDGSGCQESPLSCNDHTIQRQCFWNYDQSIECIWNSISNLCIEKRCEFLNEIDPDLCLLHQCNSDGTSCITRQDCSQYKARLSCYLDHEGNSCIFFNNQCYLQRCEFAPKLPLSDTECQKFGGTGCVSNQTVGCKDIRSQCQKISESAYCLLYNGCIWSKNYCRDWTCEDANSMMNHNECLQFGCVGIFIGGCQRWPASCEEYLYEQDCFYGTQTSPCIWLNKKCIMESAYSNGITNQQCSQSSLFLLYGFCRVKTLNDLSTPPITHEECYSQLEDYTVGELGGCVKLQTKCSPYKKKQCYMTLEKKLCIWKENKCALMSCEDLPFQTHSDCQLQTIIQEKCQLNLNGQGCARFEGSLFLKNENPSFEILFPLDNGETKQSPLINQLIEGNFGDYGYGYYVRLFAFYPKVLTNGYSTKTYFISRLKNYLNIVSEISESSNTGDKTLLVLFSEGDYIFQTYDNLQSILFDRSLEAPRLLDGVWTFLYYSYSFETKKLKAFMRFGMGPELSIEGIGILHAATDRYTFTVGGKDGSYSQLNGYFQKIVFVTGKNAFAESFENAYAKLGHYQTGQPSSIENIIYSVKGEPDDLVRTFEEGPLEFKTAKRYQFAEFYRICGWFLLFPQTVEWTVLFRLKQDPEDQISGNVKWGERTLLLLLQKWSLQYSFYFHTYSYESIMLLSSPIENPIIVGDMTETYFSEKWIFISMAYSKVRSQLQVQVISKQSYYTNFLNQVYHLSSEAYYLYFGDNQLIPAARGQRGYLNFIFGSDDKDIGSPTTANELFLGRSRIPFSAFSSAKSNFSCSDPDWLCQDQHYFCEAKCTIRRCDDFVLSTDPECAAALPNSKCRTNGQRCVQRGSCEAVFEQVGCTFSSINQQCLWKNGQCLKKRCEMAPLIFKTALECEIFLPYHSCVPRKGGGCVRKRTCVDIQTEDACLNDLEGHPCIWVSGLCQSILCTPVCGDGIFDPATEQCDDGNQFPHDGCFNCEIQCPKGCLLCQGMLCFQCDQTAGWYLSNSVCKTICGDGIVAGDENCDDGNLKNYDGCSRFCLRDCQESCKQCDDGVCSFCAEGWYLWIDSCISVCGDGIKVGVEQCDDGNSEAMDGCDDCLVRSGFHCIETEQRLSICNPSSDFQVQLSEIKSMRTWSEQAVLIQLPKIRKQVDLDKLKIIFSNLVNPDFVIQQLGQDYILIVRPQHYVTSYVIQVSISDQQEITAAQQQILINSTISIWPHLSLSPEMKESSQKFNNFSTVTLGILLVLATISYFLGNSHIFWNTLDTLQEFLYLKYINVPFPEHLQTYLEIYDLFQITLFLRWLGIIELDNLDALQLPSLKSEGKLRNLNASYFNNIFSIVLVYVCSLTYYQLLYRLFLRILHSKVVQQTLFQSTINKSVEQLVIQSFSKIRRSTMRYLLTFPHAGVMRLFYFSLNDCYFSIFLQLSANPEDSFFYWGNQFSAIAILISSFEFMRQYSQVSHKAYQTFIYKDLFQGFNLANPWVRQIQTLMILKKMFSMALLLLLQGYPVYQIKGLIVLTTAHLAFLHYRNPFSSMSEQIKAIVQNLNLLICLITFFFYMDSPARLNPDFIQGIGWANVSLLTSSLITNLFIDTHGFYKTCFRKKQLNS